MGSKKSTPLGKGYVQVYTGNCKGKTTAAMGLAFRAMGSGLKTYIGQFMKGQYYGELEAAKMSAPYITIEQFGEPTFVHVREATQKDIDMARNGLEKTKEAIFSGSYDIIVFDEIITAHFFQLVSLSDMLEIIKSKPDGVEVVMTGRYAPQELIDAADMVTEMKEIKHYFKKGVKVRKGIEN